MAQRIQWVDSAKGIGILLVIIGHTQMTENIHALIYAFHLPLFFLLSGIFLFSKERPMQEELVKKAKGLMIPYFWFNLILFLFDWIKNTLEAKAASASVADTNLFSFANGLLTGDRMDAYLWFLPCLFFAQFILLFFTQSKKHLLYVASGSAFVGIAINHFIGQPLPMSLDAACIAATFIAIGVYIRDMKFKLPPYAYLVALAIFLACHYLNLRYTDYSGIDMFDCRYGNFLYFFGAAFAGIFLVIALVQRFPNSKFLTYFGRNSLLIYCSHKIFLISIIIVLKRVPLPIQDAETLIFVRSIIQTIGACLLCVPTIYIVNRYCPWLIGKSKTSKK